MAGIPPGVILLDETSPQEPGPVSHPPEGYPANPVRYHGCKPFSRGKHRADFTGRNDPGNDSRDSRIRTGNTGTMESPVSGHGPAAAKSHQPGRRINGIRRHARDTPEGGYTDMARIIVNGKDR